MSLITDDYRTLNRQLHELRHDYGTTAPKYARQVRDLASAVDAHTILDYGCGKGLLAKELPRSPIKEYDPAIPGKETAPAPADLVVCIDVLEHIEPACLAAVLNHLHSLTLKAVFLTVATRPAKKTLPDGRNAHLIVQPINWWLPRIIGYWDTRLVHASAHEFAYFGVVK